MNARTATSPETLRRFLFNLLPAMKNIFLLITAIFLFRCNAVERKQQSAGQLPKPKTGTVHFDTVDLKETFGAGDTAITGHLSDRLQPIRENFKRINSITKWTSITTKELAESTEGGEAAFYSSNGTLEKIETKELGETYQQVTEYYLLNGSLSFVYRKLYKYNRPIYYDSAAMKENKDDQAFDIKKSEIIEGRSYFEEGKLIHQLNSRNDHSPPTDAYLPGEQKRMLADYGKLKAMAK